MPKRKTNVAPPEGAIVNDKEESEVTPKRTTRAKRTEKPSEDLQKAAESEKPPEDTEVEVKDIVADLPEDVAANIPANATGPAIIKELTKLSMVLAKQIGTIRKLAGDEPANKKVGPADQRHLTLQECNQGYFANAKKEREAKVAQADALKELFGDREMRNLRTGEAIRKKVLRNLR